jgi:hypothetical protein
MSRTPLDPQISHAHRLISIESHYTSLNVPLVAIFCVAVYRENVSIDVNNSTILCRDLNAQRRDENNINKEKQTRNDGFSCEPGKFGNDCMISCKDILGMDEQYCQKHKICHESKCECAWGYEGSECDSGEY